MTRLILIRHGQTEWNAAGRYQGQIDLPLNALGRQQAEQIVQQLDGTQLAAIYASDLARARETADCARSSRANGKACRSPRSSADTLGNWNNVERTHLVL
jgi:broad specificity phosphatase PhoE